MKWLRKWAYLIVFLGTGAGYLACVDHWQVYGEPLSRAQDWFEELTGSETYLGGEDENIIPVGGKVQDPEMQDGEQESGSLSDTEGTGADKDEGEQDGAGESSGQGEEEEGDSQSGSSADGENNLPDETHTQDPASDGTEADNVPPGPPEYMTVEDDYFSDALFIGDSRTVGMYEYGGLEEVTTFYASKGLTIYKMFDSEIVPAEGGKITVEEGLQQNSFSKIYLMIGINEMGTGTVESFLEAYEAAVAHLRELQPDAIIYLQAIIKVTTERSEQGDYINNEGIIARNEGIARLADNEHVFFLDVNPLICDETGGMIPEYTFDGVHLKAVYIDIWKDFLKTHAVSLP